MEGKNPEQILPLNAKVIFNRLQDGEERTYEYTSALDLIVYLKKLFESGMIQKIKLARNVQSNDTTDKLYGAGYGREERTLVPIKITNQMKAKLRHVSEAKYNYFTFDNHDYPETKMVVKIGDRLRTIDLHGLDELSVEEALPDELLLPDGTIDFPNFETHMLEVAEEYIEHLPNKF